MFDFQGKHQEWCAGHVFFGWTIHWQVFQSYQTSSERSFGFGVSWVQIAPNWKCWEAQGVSMDDDGIIWELILSFHDGMMVRVGTSDVYGMIRIDECMINAWPSSSIKFTKHQISTSWWLNQPIWTKICSSNWIISPGIGMKINNIWNHQVVQFNCCFLFKGSRCLFLSMVCMILHVHHLATKTLH